MNDPARAATLLAIFLTTFALTFREIFVYLLYLERVNTFWYALGSFLLFWVLAFRLELAAAEIEAELLDSRRRQRREERAPRPFAPQSQQGMRRISKTVVGIRELYPNFVHQYEDLYKHLRRKKWSITKANLKVKSRGDYIFRNIDAKYMDIVREWARAGYLDGYVKGRRGEKYTLNAAGQAKFKEVGNVKD